MANVRILVVDDEPDIREVVAYNLKKAGYEVLTAENGEDAIKAAKRYQPELIIMDIMMPVMDGIEACRLLRLLPEFEHTFIVFLTARNEEYSEVSGFDVGADDYMTKPIKPRVLLSRVQAILRRNKLTAEEQQDRVEAADLIIDREAYLVFRGDEKIVLPRKEFELLYLLASKPGKVYTRESILKSIWEEAVVVTNRTIDVHIRKLREKIGDHYVTTVKGVGYKFESDILLA